MSISRGRERAENIILLYNNIFIYCRREDASCKSYFNGFTLENPPLRVGHVSTLYRQQVLFLFQRKGFRRLPVFAHSVHVGAAAAAL